MLQGTLKNRPLLLRQAGRDALFFEKAAVRTGFAGVQFFDIPLGAGDIGWLWNGGPRRIHSGLM